MYPVTFLTSYLIDIIKQFTRPLFYLRYVNIFLTFSQGLVILYEISDNSKKTKGV